MRTDESSTRAIAHRWLRSLLVATAVLPLLGACGDGPAGPRGNIVEGVDLDAVFAAPSSQELNQVLSDWAARTPVAEGVRLEMSAAFPLGTAPGTLRVFSHLVDGHRHYGAVISPDGAAPGSLPVLVYAHGGDAGVNVSELSLIVGFVGDVASSFVYLVPSFRSEPLVVGSAAFLSEGPPSPWDRDADDALALLEVALAQTPAADPGRIALLGLSRGAGVGLLMAIRDPRIDLVVDFFGPTDFFDPWVQQIVADALRGQLRDLPGLAVLDQRFIQPLRTGDLSVQAFRAEIVRRSAVLFADRLPAVQVHHGTADPVVAVSQAHSLVAALQALPRPPGHDEFWIYSGGGHSPLTLSGSIPRTVTFLSRLLDDAL